MARRICLAGGGLAVHLLSERTVIESAGDGAAASWDGEGRPVLLQEGGRVLRRGLSGRFLLRDRFRPGGLPLPEEKEGETIARFLRLARSAMEGSDEEGISPKEREELERRLAGILSWDEQAHVRDARRFARIWKPVPVLPPDRTLSLVLQATEGCPWGRCLFCGLFPEGGFRVKGEEEFARHVHDALLFLGRSASGRNSIFIGDGDPLAAPDRILLPLIDRLLRESAEAERRGEPLPASLDLYAFARLSTLAGRDASSLAAYGRRGFRRLYVGVETGDPELYAALRKSGDLGDLPGAVRLVHAAGMKAGLIFLAGAGGRRWRKRHREETLRLLENARLGPGDMVYVSPIADVPGSGHRAWLEEEGIPSLAPEEIEEEAAAMIRALPRGTKAAFYPIRSFVY